MATNEYPPKISLDKSNEDKKQNFNAEIFSLDAFRSKKEE